MVYQVFSYKSRSNASSVTTRPRLKPVLREGSFLTLLILWFISCLLFTYDLLSYPIYFLIQRPDRRIKEAASSKSDQVDARTWVKFPGDRVQRYKFRGKTLAEIFASAIDEFSSKPCLGYRAVITCPVLSQNECGRSVLQEKSFRSDYTWYTFEQIGRRVQDIASGLYHRGTLPGTRCLFLAGTSLEWFCAAQACFQIGAQIVLAPEISCNIAFLQIITEAEIRVIFASCDRINQICRLLESIKSNSTNPSPCCHLTKIILTDWLFSVDFAEPAFAELRRSSEGVVDEIFSLGQVEETGVEYPIELRCTKQFVENDFDLRERLEEPRLRLLDRLFGSKRRPSQRRSVHYSTGSDSLKQNLPDAGDSAPTTNSNRTESINNLEGQGCPTSLEAYRGTMKHFDYSKSDDTAMIVYKHGSLSQLKSVKLTHGYLTRSNHYLFLDGKFNTSKSVHCAALDLDNMVEFMTEMAIFSNGGSIGYSCSRTTLFYDGQDLFERDKSDLEALNATFLLLRPYQIESLRSSVQKYMSLDYNPILGFLLINLLSDYKKYWARKFMDTPITDRIFCAPLRRLFGSRLSFILCNGVTDCSDTRDFFAFVLGIPIVELYGLPEADICAIAALDDDWSCCSKILALAEQSVQFCQRKDQNDNDEDQEDYNNMQLLPPKVNRNTFRFNNSKNLVTTSVFRPSYGTRIRLEDWEDFRATDQPFARGRLVLGGDTVCEGYFSIDLHGRGRFYKDPNGITWFRSDHIARVFPNGSFEIISAMSDIIKMGDGQLISLSQIEHSLRNSQFVDNVCAICVDERKFVIVLVVPNLRRLALKSPNEANLKMAIGSEPEPEELHDLEFRREVCNDRLLCEFVTEHLNGLMSKAGFQTVQSRFHLVPEIWTPESELVTPSFEPRRAAIQSHYASDIKSILGMQFLSSRMRLSVRCGHRLRKSPLPNTKNAHSNQLQVVNRLSY